MAGFASVHFFGQAEFWYGTYSKARGKVSWPNFVRDLYARFSSLFRESIIGEFHKLRQTTTVEHFYNDFETLTSSLVSEGINLEEDYFIQSFISGLKDEIRLEVEKFDVGDLSRAIFLARKQEASLNNAWHHPRTTARTQPTLINTSPAKLSPNSTSWRSKPIQTNPHVSMLVVDEEEGEDTPPVYDEELPAQEEPAVEKEGDMVEITVHAITGTPSSNTFKLWGMHDKEVFSILIDTGSTHNFIDPNIAGKLGCVAVATTLMTIMVADGNRVTSDSMCQDFTWTLQDQTFSSDMMILPLGGCHCVLGLQWLKTLGQVQFDFKAMTMTITKVGKAITFQGGNGKTEVKLLSAEGMSKYLAHNVGALCGQICHMEKNNSANMEEIKYEVIEEMVEEREHNENTYGGENAHAKGKEYVVKTMEVESIEKESQYRPKGQ
ncbi:hypothetical protein RJ640_001605 [Escallonia rubra]|uniref:Retrotransposon gag domain-containing protein n=1 Tax=Escallonia rubra TaxID=112253 RepID=A0AA88QHW3_9ASTE|nr:hypothetical protein RJ640_001605 [Escallonia rubra]